MQTLIIRIEDPPAHGGAFPLRGLLVSPERQGEVEHAAGKIPWPLPELDPEQPGRDVVADVQQVMLAAGGFTPDQVGRYLWGLLAATEVGTWWQQAESAAEDGGVKTVLDVQARELRQLPWELLTRDPDGWRPFQSRQKPWARGTGPGEDTDDLLVPVRMLVVVGDPQDRDLRVDDELDAIVGALRDVPGRWHVHLLVKPTLAVMRSVLEDLRPHVLHVIAHGTVTADSAVLVIPVDEQNPWELTTADVANLPSPAPRLVVLNACRSGAAGGSKGLAASWTFTEAFLNRGCGAVVTMQGNIASEAAVPFSAAFYRAVAAGEGVDVAAARGREAASDARRVAKDDRSWAMPSLHLRVRSDCVLPVRLAVNADLVRQPPYRDAYEPVVCHVDRTKERWELLRRLAPENGRPRQPLFLVAGLDKVGKSAVVKSALLTCHLRGRRVAYVDLRRCKGEPWLSVLRYIRNQVLLWLPRAAAEPVRRFDHDLAFFKERRMPDDYASVSARTDDGGGFDRGSEDFKEWIRRIFASFRDLLQATANDEPLLLALDHMHKIYDPDLRDYVVPELLAPIARGEVGHVHAVLVGDAGWLEGLRVADPTLFLPQPIIVPMFRLGEIDRLGREYCARKNKLPVGAPVVQLLNVLLDKTKECTGEDLDRVLKIVELRAG
jgi:CHAT domain-containing protein/AAA ATPase-like protein